MVGLRERPEPARGSHSRVILDIKAEVLHIYRMNVQSVSKRKRILDASLDLIAEKGIHNTPMTLIAKRAGVATGTIYHHFANKEELVNQLYLEVKTDYIRGVFTDPSREMPYRDRMSLLWKKTVDHFISKPSFLSFDEQLFTSPLISAETRREGEERLSPITDFLREGIENESLREMDISLMLYVTFGTIKSAARLHISGVLLMTEEQREVAFQSCWDGVRRMPD